MTKLTKKQELKFTRAGFDLGYGHEPGRMVVTVRHDDRCGNGHNTFSITYETRDSCGCCDETIARNFPDLESFLKWHLCSTDEPMHYVANTVYHVLQHGPNMAHVYFGDDKNGIRKNCVKYCKIKEAEKIVGSDDRYNLEIDHGTAKTHNLGHARNSAIWPDATDLELTAPMLEIRLAERLPALMAEFRAAVESLGLEY